MKTAPQLFSEGRRAAESAFYDRVPKILPMDQRKTWTAGWWTGCLEVGEANLEPLDGPPMEVNAPARIPRWQAFRALLTGRAWVGIHAVPRTLSKVYSLRGEIGAMRALGPWAAVRLWWAQRWPRKDAASEPAATPADVVAAEGGAG